MNVEQAQSLLSDDAFIAAIADQRSIADVMGSHLIVFGREDSVIDTSFDVGFIHAKPDALRATLTRVFGIVDADKAAKDIEAWQPTEEGQRVVVIIAGGVFIGFVVGYQRLDDAQAIRASLPPIVGVEREEFAKWLVFVNTVATKAQIEQTAPFRAKYAVVVEKVALQGGDLTSAVIEAFASPMVIGSLRMRRITSALQHLMLSDPKVKAVIVEEILA